MPFIASKYAALIFDVKIVTLQNAAMRNSTRYTYTKYQNKLLFKVSPAQLRIALNKGLIDANIEVYNDDLTLIQDFFKMNSTRRVNGRERSNKVSNKVCQSSGGHARNDDGISVKCGEKSSSSSKTALHCKQSHMHGQSSECGNDRNIGKTDLANRKSNKQHSTQYKENEGTNECEHTVGDILRGRLDRVEDLQSGKGELDGRANFTASTSIGIYGDVCCSEGSICELSKSVRFVDRERNTNTCGTSVSNDCTECDSRDCLGAVDGVFYSVDDKLCNNDLHSVIKNGEEIGKSDNSFGTKKGQGAVDVECIEYCSFSVSSDSVYGQHKTKTNVISNVGGSATLTKAGKTSIRHTQRKTKSYGQTERNDTKFNANYIQGELNANNKENSSDIGDNFSNGKHDAGDRGVGAGIYDNNGCDDARCVNGIESKGVRELTQSTSTLLSTTKGLKSNSSSKASNTNETSTLNECLNERNLLVGNYALLNTPKEELAAANEKAIILSKIEQRVANNESIKSICNELNISRMQYYRMLKAYKTQGLAGLVDKRTTAKDSKAGEIIPDVLKEQAIMIWRACGAGGINYAQMHESLHNYAGMKLGYDYKNFLDGKVEELFSVKTLIAFMDEYKRINHLEASIVEKGLDKTKSYKQPAQGNSKNRVSERNDMWEIDSSPLDCMLQDENGVEFRPHILSVIDIYSGRMVCTLGDVSNALSLVRLLWKAIDTMGLPLKIKGDNGKDYLSKHFQGVINRLGITYDFTAPYSGELKPFVERAFKTIQHSVISLLPGYLGHNLATREIIEQRTPKKDRIAKNEFGKVKKTNQSHLMDFSQAEQVLDTAVNKWNIISNKRVKNRISRIDAFNSCDNPLTKMTYEYFLARAGELYEKKVQKKGININSRTYISADMPSVGTSIKVVTNIDNISEIYVYDGDFNFICIAKDNNIAELSAEELKANKKAFDKECQAINKVIKDTNISEFTKLTLEHDKKVIKQLHEEKLKDETIILRDDEASKKYKEKGKLLKEVSSCLDYTAPKIQTINDEDEMSYEDLIRNSKIS